MSRWKGIFRAAAPLTALLVIAGGARLLPAVFGKAESAEAENALHTAAQKSPPIKSKGGKSAPAAPPKPADTKTQAVLQRVVGGQLAAFRKDDFVQALRYSAPQFRQSFTPAAFRQMVKGSYAGLLTYKTLRFVPARVSAGVAMMPVFLKSEGGGEVGYLYILRSNAVGTTARPKKGDKSTKTAPKAVNWYIEGVSTLGGGAGPGSDPVTDIREI